MKKIIFLFCIFIAIITITHCNKDTDVIATYDAVVKTFGTKIDLRNLENYNKQSRPIYITKDNLSGNIISNSKATLGRVLFYDKNLSIDNSISCGSCHKQSLAFGDSALASSGVSAGLTGRHSMRLINARFSAESKFFWDERALSLEVQTTQPMQDHAEMGFSGKDGRPTFKALLSKLQSLDYYKELLNFVYEDTTITEAKMQECLAHFIRSIQSFDSKYDAGRVKVNSDNEGFENFTAQENIGKNLFLSPPIFDANSNRIKGGLGCDGCHNAPEFDINPNSGNNGIITIINKDGIDITNTRAPTLRDLLNANGEPNTPMMHNGNITSIKALLGHYGNIKIAPGNTKLDPKLKPNNIGQQLKLQASEVDAVIAFLKTLTGSSVYTDKKWSNPF